MHGMPAFYNGMHDGMHGFPTECTDLALCEAGCRGCLLRPAPGQCLLCPRKGIKLGVRHQATSQESGRSCGSGGGNTLREPDDAAVMTGQLSSATQMVTDNDRDKM